MSIELDHISFSCIDLYDTCPFAWMKTYVEGIRDPGNHYSAFGSHIHKALEIWGKLQIRSKPWGLSGLLDYHKRKFPIESFSTFKLRQEYSALGDEILERFYKAEGHIIPFKVEHEANLILPDLPPILMYIDRIDQTNQGKEVHDYKTGRVFTKQKVDEHLQLSLYALVVEQDFGELPCKLTYKFLKHPAKKTGFQIREALRSDDDLKKAKERVYKFWQKVQDEKFEQNYQGYFCDNFCYFKKKSICKPNKKVWAL